jgi:hypothetical protein
MFAMTNRSMKKLPMSQNKGKMQKIWSYCSKISEAASWAGVVASGVRLYISSKRLKAMLSNLSNINEDNIESRQICTHLLEMRNRLLSQEQ